MKNKTIAAILVSLMVMGSLSGCGSASNDAAETTSQVETEGEDEKEAAEAEAAAKAAQEAEAARKAEEEAAAAKEAEANEYYEAGRTCLYGTDEIEIDLESAYNNFEKAKELGKTEANFYLGILCDRYSYPEENYEMAKTYYESCGDNPYAQVALAYLYCWGDGVEVDEEKAKELYQPLIEQGYVEGYGCIAETLYNKEEYAAAFENFTKAAEGTEQVFIANVMGNIGYLYRYGEGVELDYAKAMEWYEKAAGLGERASMAEIGLLYYYGEGVDQDYEKALEWFEKAADLRHSNSMYNIGVMYAYGEGVEQDYGMAMKWYEKAADLGHSVAMNNIGILYYSGEGVEQDYEKALEWFEKAADLGNETAKANAEATKQLLQQ